MYYTTYLCFYLPGEQNNCLQQILPLFSSCVTQKDFLVKVSFTRLAQNDIHTGDMLVQLLFRVLMHMYSLSLFLQIYCDGWKSSKNAWTPLRNTTGWKGPFLRGLNREKSFRSRRQWLLPWRVSYDAHHIYADSSVAHRTNETISFSYKVQYILLYIFYKHIKRFWSIRWVDE